MTEEISLLEEVKKLKSIADIGLLYAESEYDKHRYLEAQEISFKLLQQLTGNSITDLKYNFELTKEYPTAKVDIRGLILSPDGKILLVRESTDGNWSLPGGWADVGYSPKEVVIKECKEETGLDVSVQRLLAVFDKKFHPHPFEAFYVYKMVFLCEATSTEITKGFDVLDVQYFDVENLPALSENRILKNQLEIVFKKAVSGDIETYFE